MSECYQIWGKDKGWEELTFGWIRFQGNYWDTPTLNYVCFKHFSYVRFHTVLNSLANYVNYSTHTMQTLH